MPSFSFPSSSKASFASEVCDAGYRRDVRSRPSLRGRRRQSQRRGEAEDDDDDEIADLNRRCFSRRGAKNSRRSSFRIRTMSRTSTQHSTTRTTPRRRRSDHSSAAGTGRSAADPPRHHRQAAKHDEAAADLPTRRSPRSWASTTCPAGTASTKRSTDSRRARKRSSARRRRCWSRRSRNSTSRPTSSRSTPGLSSRCTRSSLAPGVEGLRHQRPVQRHPRRSRPRRPHRRADPGQEHRRHRSPQRAEGEGPLSRS